MRISTKPKGIRTGARGGGWGGPADLSDPAFVKAIDDISKAVQSKDTAKATALIAQSVLIYGPSIVDAGQELFSIQNDSLAALEAKEIQYQYKVSSTTGQEQAKWKAKLAAVRRRIASLEKLQESAYNALENGNNPSLYEKVPTQSWVPEWAIIALLGGGLLLGGIYLLKRKN